VRVLPDFSLAQQLLDLHIVAAIVAHLSTSTGCVNLPFASLTPPHTYCKHLSNFPHICERAMLPCNRLLLSFYSCELCARLLFPRRLFQRFLPFSSTCVFRIIILKTIYFSIFLHTVPLIHDSSFQSIRVTMIIAFI
jgi:hypothetical protein